jgi:phospholipase A1
MITCYSILFAEEPVDHQKFTENLTIHQPMYIISGIPDTKIQFSFKYTVMKSLFLGYTQRMFWDLDQTSAPLRDVNYNPEMFYRMSVNSLNYPYLKFIDFGFFEHMSNGKKDLESRSFNRGYVRFDTEQNFYKSMLLKLNLKLFYFYNVAEENPNFRDYQDLWEAKISLTNFFDYILDNGELSFRVLPGKNSDFSKGGMELGLQFRFNLFGFSPYVYMQAYKGYCESLLDYEKNQEAYRIGFLICQ